MPLVAPKLIDAARVCVRPVSESDLPGSQAVNGDERVTRFLGHGPWQGMADAEAWFQRITASQASGSALEFVIVARQTGSILGRCGLFDFEEANACALLGYVLGHSYWRQGYMSEALTALMDGAFHEMGLRRVEARVEAQNTASGALLRHLGFRGRACCANDGSPTEKQWMRRFMACFATNGHAQPPSRTSRSVNQADKLPWSLTNPRT